MANEKNTLELQLLFLLILWMPMTVAFFLIASSHLPSKYLISGTILIVYGLIEFLIFASMERVGKHKLATLFFLKPTLLILFGIAFVLDNWSGYTGKALSVGIFAILIIQILHPIFGIGFAISKKRKTVS